MKIFNALRTLAQALADLDTAAWLDFLLSQRESSA
jgi:hypothetical protein